LLPISISIAYIQGSCGKRRPEPAVFGNGRLAAQDCGEEAMIGLHTALGLSLAVWLAPLAARGEEAPIFDSRQALQSWTEPAKRGQGLGQLLVQDSQSGAFRRLQVARYHVNVVLAPPVALVQIDQTFYNPFNEQREGTFVFNLPPGASVSRFAMYVTNTDLIEGELIDRERAREVYGRIVSRRRDPAILEQIGDNLFQMRVFPIFARDVKRILLDFTVPLEAMNGAC
jgi:hypothetical protein